MEKNGGDKAQILFLIHFYYKIYCNKLNRKDKVKIKNSLAIKIGRSAKQVFRYFKDLDNGKEVNLDRGYGRSIPLHHKECEKFLHLLKNGISKNEILKELALSPQKFNRLGKYLYIPFYLNGFICIQVNGLVQLNDYEIEYDEKMMNEIISEISFMFEENETTKLNDSVIIEYYRKKINAVIERKSLSDTSSDSLSYDSEYSLLSDSEESLPLDSEYSLPLNSEESLTLDSEVSLPSDNEENQLLCLSENENVCNGIDDLMNDLLYSSIDNDDLEFNVYSSDNNEY